MKRSDKLNTEISRAVSKAISQVFDISESGVFTIRNVDILNDYSEVRIWISRIGGEKDFFSRLKSAQNRIQRLTFERISLIRTPKILFIEDFTGEYAQKMEELLKK